MPGKKRTTPRDTQALGWDLQDIEQLIDVLAKRGITEFEWKKGPLKVRITRGEIRANTVLPSHQSEIRQPTDTANPSLLPTDAAPSAVPAVEVTTEAKEDLFIVKSPIVGTFFSAPSPNAPPFVKAGDEVHVGQVLCIVEAMKLMNEIESEVAGEIARIYVENGQPVEYGQTLFAIRPTRKKSG